MVLMLILISAMLAVTRNEVGIAGYHRDSVRALEYAQSAVDEAVRRMEGGHTIIPGFEASVGPDNTAHVTLEGVGTSAASSSFQEIRAEATVGRATRRLSYLIFAISDMLPPDIIFGYSLATQGSVDVTSGDLYSWTFVKYKRFPPNNTNWCYIRPCAGSPSQADELAKWYPGARRSIRRGVTIDESIIGPLGGSDLDARKDLTIESVIDFTCPAGPTGAKLTATIGGTGAWNAADLKQDNTGTVPSNTLLYGCDADNLPYTYVRETFDDDGMTKSAWFKTVIYEDWFDRYWILDDSAADDGTPATCCIGAYRKRVAAEQIGGHNLVSEPQYGAVPPYPDFDALEASLNQAELDAANQYMSGGGNISGSTSLRLGCKYPEMSCPGNQSDYNVVWLDNGGEYRIGSNLQGHGTLVIDGDLRLNGNLEWWGTMFVNGAIIRANGSVIVHGGLITRDTVETNGDLTVEGGSSVGSAPLGAVTVIRKAWWER
jgi:hypothetical protein